LAARRAALAEVPPEHRVLAARARLAVDARAREGRRRLGDVADVAGADAAVRRRRVGIAEVREARAPARPGRVGALRAGLPRDERGARLVDDDLRLVL